MDVSPRGRTCSPTTSPDQRLPVSSGLVVAELLGASPTPAPEHVRRNVVTHRTRPLIVGGDQLIGHPAEKSTILASRPLEQQTRRFGLDPQACAITRTEKVGAEHEQLAHAHPDWNRRTHSPHARWPLAHLGSPALLHAPGLTTVLGQPRTRVEHVFVSMSSWGGARPSMRRHLDVRTRPLGLPKLQASSRSAAASYLSVRGTRPARHRATGSSWSGRYVHVAADYRASASAAGWSRPPWPVPRPTGRRRRCRMARWRGRSAPGSPCAATVRPVATAADEPQRSSRKRAHDRTAVVRAGR